MARQCLQPLLGTVLKSDRDVVRGGSKIALKVPDLGGPNDHCIKEKAEDLLVAFRAGEKANLHGLHLIR
jgi:hypothetical protein